MSFAQRGISTAANSFCAACWTSQAVVRAMVRPALCIDLSITTCLFANEAGSRSGLRWWIRQAGGSTRHLVGLNPNPPRNNHVVCAWKRPPRSRPSWCQCRQCRRLVHSCLLRMRAAPAPFCFWPQPAPGPSRDNVRAGSKPKGTHGTLDILEALGC